MKLFGRDRKPSEQLDLGKIAVRPFSKSEITYNTFSCGHTAIDRFLKNKAAKVSRRFEHRVFVAVQPGSPCCLGYYALQLGSDSVPDLPREELGYTQNHLAFPAVHLSFLGVDQRYQRQGLGRHLLQDVFERASKISEHAGFYALTLQSIDEESTKFYLRLGFTPYSEGRQPKMLYAIGNILKLTGRAD